MDDKGNTQTYERKQKMQERTLNYGGIKKRISRKCRIAKEGWMSEICREIENLPIV